MEITEPKGQVAMELSSMESNITELQLQTERLFSTFGCVINMNTKPGSVTEGDEPILVPMASQLYCFNRRLATLINLLVELNSASEL